MATKKQEKILERLERENPSAKIDTGLVYSINGKAYGDIHVAAAVLGVSVRRVNSMRAKGMEVEELYTDGKEVVFDLKYIIRWQATHLRMEGSAAKGNASKQKPIATQDSDLDSLDHNEADRLLKIEKLKEQKIKNAATKGELIPAEDTDRVSAELAALHMVQYKNDLELLPTILEQKKRQEISGILDDHYRTRMEEMHGLVRKVIPITEKTVYQRLKDAK
jgi:phage terminase Nu1 subunit (DNA packaging protein)